jgi:hypothetical protein
MLVVVVVVVGQDCGGRIAVGSAVLLARELGNMQWRLM